MNAAAPSHRTVAERLSGWFALVAGFATLALVVATRIAPGGDGIESGVLVAIRRLADLPGQTTHVILLAMLAATFVGSFPTLVAIVLVAAIRLWLRGIPGVAVRLAAASLAGMALANGAKLLVGRPRPEVVAHWAAVSSSSFPSGHSADSAIVLLLVAGALARPTNVGGGARLAALAALLIIMIGTSRLYLGVHWPSDVLGGWTFGAGWAFASGPFVRHGHALGRARRPSRARPADLAGPAISTEEPLPYDIGRRHDQFDRSPDSE